jgi:hypothetical protein
LSSAARAQESMMPKPDDYVVFDLSGEGWVTTKTARVTVTVEAAVSGTNAGTMRSDMMKAVNEVAKSDWRLVSFSRSQDQTGLERWSAAFEARLPENTLNGLGDNAKKQSKAGMQLSVGEIDFTPTSDEMEAARASVRAQLYKSANDQLAALNTTLVGRNYRIAAINFTGYDGAMPPMPQVLRGPAPLMKAMAMSASNAETAAPASMERAEKVTLSARVTLAAFPPPSTTQH